MVSSSSFFLLPVLALSLILFILGFVFLLSVLVSLLFGAPYVPVSKKSIRKILLFGGLSSSDIFYDLGSGDGRILVCGLSDFNVSRAVGYEVAPWPYFKALLLIKYKRLKKLRLFRKNCLKADIGGATFIYLYLFPRLVDRVVRKIICEGTPKTRVLCIEFPIDTSRYTEFQLLKSGKVDSVMAYLYELKPHNAR